MNFVSSYENVFEVVDNTWPAFYIKNNLSKITPYLNNPAGNRYDSMSEWLLSDEGVEFEK
jgi:hypothetical protein